MTTTPARILIVEDDADSLKMLCLLLESWGYQVDEARRGDIALDKIRDNCPDVVISDLVMPGMSGLELLHAIRTERKECLIFFILTTGYGTVQKGVRAITQGADEVIIKPIDPDDLFELLCRHGFCGDLNAKPKT